MGKKIRVLGIGNILWADEGFGVRCIEALEQNYQFQPEIALIDGGTQGLFLLEYVTDSSHLLILDAIDYGLPPGTVKVVENDDVPRFLGAKKMSLHQTGFQEVLQVAQLTGKFPEQLVLLGCQPALLDDYGGSLTPAVKAAINPVIGLAIERLQQWGVSATKKITQVDADADSPLTINKYEQDRPDADQACRVGDSRFLPMASVE